jgi:hypothetical protein
MPPRSSARDAAPMIGSATKAAGGAISAGDSGLQEGRQL